MDNMKRIREKLVQDLNEVEEIKIQDKRAPLSNKKSESRMKLKMQTIESPPNLEDPHGRQLIWMESRRIDKI